METKGLQVTGRKQPKLPRDDHGYEERIRRANRRTNKALRDPLAQDASILKMGTTFHLNRRFDRATKEELGAELSIGVVDEDRLAVMAMLLRPFTLEQESIYHIDVAKGLRRFADTDDNRTMVDQLGVLWGMCSKSRMTAHVYGPDREELIPGGAGSAAIADRVLYSEMVHADDASDLLEHIPEEWRQWTLATLIGDWAAMAAHQQYVMYCVRPDLVPELTSWAGDGLTIFRRFGLETKKFT